MTGTDWWRGRRVLVTGHTGFKGAWLCLWLEALGAEVTGIAMPPPTTPSLFEALSPWPRLRALTGDLRNPAVADAAVAAAQPEIVFHLAAQSLVRPSYADPAATFATNTLGTAHVLDAVRRAPSVSAVIVVTSDKVYANDGSGRQFVEDDRLGGHDPYSASKACQELVAASYRASFFADGRVRLLCVRAGNVIGGGDWAVDRLVPDFFRAAVAGQPVAIRNPSAVRPWQHVLEPLAGYLRAAEALHAGQPLPPALNFGPPPEAALTVRAVIEALTRLWGGNAGWQADAGRHPPEAGWLGLDATLATRVLGWRPKLPLPEALAWTVAWYRAHAEAADMRAVSAAQIAHYRSLP